MSTTVVVVVDIVVVVLVVVVLVADIVLVVKIVLVGNIIVLVVDPTVRSSRPIERVVQLIKEVVMSPARTTASLATMEVPASAGPAEATSKATTTSAESVVKPTRAAYRREKPRVLRIMLFSSTTD